MINTDRTSCSRTSTNQLVAHITIVNKTPKIEKAIAISYNSHTKQNNNTNIMAKSKTLTVTTRYLHLYRVVPKTTASTNFANLPSLVPRTAKQ